MGCGLLDPSLGGHLSMTFDTPLPKAQLPHVNFSQISDFFEVGCIGL